MHIFPLQLAAAIVKIQIQYKAPKQYQQIYYKYVHTYIYMLECTICICVLFNITSTYVDVYLNVYTGWALVCVCVRQLMPANACNAFTYYNNYFCFTTTFIQTYKPHIQPIIHYMYLAAFVGISFLPLSALHIFLPLSFLYLHTFVYAIHIYVVLYTFCDNYCKELAHMTGKGERN